MPVIVKRPRAKSDLIETCKMRIPKLELGNQRKLRTLTELETIW